MAPKDTFMSQSNASEGSQTNCRRSIVEGNFHTLRAWNRKYFPARHSCIGACKRRDKNLKEAIPNKDFIENKGRTGQIGEDNDV